MAQSQFSLSWDDHSKNLCNGLSFLQQNGEFVDMTIAADGHLVKVHQVIMALSSPFFKDLIASAQCPHPVIVLNKVSHKILSSILEYIYTGEVLVAIEDLKELVEAAKGLHIKGLQEMNLSQALTVDRHRSDEVLSAQIGFIGNEDENCYFEISKQPDDCKKPELHRESVVITQMGGDVDLYEIPVSEDKSIVTPGVIADVRNVNVLPSKTHPERVGTLQYTISNQGSLQLILNRFIYYLKHTNQDRSRQWRCVDYLNSCKCPAYVITKDDVVVQRILAHKHPFHDKKIWKKVREHSVFSAINDAEHQGNNKKNKEDDQCETE